jgi:hypothetical protein
MGTATATTPQLRRTRLVRVVGVAVAAAIMTGGCATSNAEGGGDIRDATYLDEIQVSLADTQVTFYVDVAASPDAGPVTIRVGPVPAGPATFELTPQQRLDLAEQVWRRQPGRFDRVLVGGGWTETDALPLQEFTASDLDDRFGGRDDLDRAPLPVDETEADDYRPGRCQTESTPQAVACLDLPQLLSYADWADTLTPYCAPADTVPSLDWLHRDGDEVTAAWHYADPSTGVPVGQARVTLVDQSVTARVECLTSATPSIEVPVPALTVDPEAPSPVESPVASPSATRDTSAPADSSVSCADVADMPLRGSQCGQAKAMVQLCDATPGTLVLIADTGGTATWQYGAPGMAAGDGITSRGNSAGPAVLSCGTPTNGINVGDMQTDVWQQAESGWGIRVASVTCAPSQEGVVLDQLDAAPDPAGMCTVLDTDGFPGYVFLATSDQPPYYSLRFAE